MSKENTTTEKTLLKKLMCISNNLRYIKNHHTIIIEYITADRDLTDGAKIFYSLVCNLANNNSDYICVASIKYFIYRLKVSYKTIQNYIKELEAIGYITRVSKKYINNDLFSTKLRLKVNTDINIFIKRYEYLREKYPNYYFNDDDLIDMKGKKFSNNEKKFSNNEKNLSNEVENNYSYNNKSNSNIYNKVSSKDLLSYFYNFDFSIINNDLINEVIDYYQNDNFYNKTKKYANLINSDIFSIKELIYLSIAYIDNDMEYTKMNDDLITVINMFLENTNINYLFNSESIAIPY